HPGASLPETEECERPAGHQDPEPAAAGEPTRVRPPCSPARADAEFGGGPRTSHGYGSAGHRFSESKLLPSPRRRFPFERHVLVNAGMRPTRATPPAAIEISRTSDRSQRPIAFPKRTTSRVFPHRAHEIISSGSPDGLP